MPMSAATTVSKVSSVHAATAPAVGNGSGNGSGIIGGSNGQQEIVATINGGGGGGSSSLSESVKTNSSISDLTAAVTTNTTASIVSNNNTNTMNAKNLKASLPQAISAFNGGPNAGINNNDAANPMKQSLVTIEHKIRNLEKRKTKLETYRAIQATGKDLSSDQNAAVAKYDAVIATLEFARDLSKQMVQFCKDAEKEQKKQARKDVIARAVAETTKIREVLVIQNVLSCLTDEAIRGDFLAGENGALKLDGIDLEALDKFCVDIQTQRPETYEDVPFIQTAQKAAELFSMTVDARPKQYSDTTFEKLRNIFQQIQDSGYLDKIYIKPTQVNNEANVNEDQLVAAEIELDANSVPTGHNSIEEGLDKLQLGDGLGNGHQESQGLVAAENILQQEQQPLLHGTQPQQLVPPQQAQQQIIQQERATPLQASGQQPNVPGNFGGGAQVPPPTQQSGSTTPVQVIYAANQAQGAPIVPPVTGGILPPPPQLVAGGYPRQMMVVYDDVTQVPARGHTTPPPQSASVAQSFGPTTVRAVEQNYFKQHQQTQHQPQNPQQFMQQMRPLSEVIGSGSFYFLQDSELDSPDVNASNIQQQAQPAQSLQPVAGIIFEQQQSAPPNGPQQPQQLTNHVEEIQQQAQTIQTQTFTNQSYPPLQQQQQQQQPQQPQQQQSATHGITNNAPSPLYQHQQKQQQQPLFSPVTPPQLLLQHDQRQQQQQPLPILTRLAPQQQLPPQSIGMQAGDVIGSNNHQNAPYAFNADNNAGPVVVNSLSYEQTLQHQLGIKPTSVVNNGEAEPVQQQQQPLTKLSTADENSNNEWHPRSSSDTNAVATAALTIVLKATSNALSATTTNNSSDTVVTNKWSTEMNALGTPTTPMHLAVTGSNNGSGISQNNSVRKNDWSSSNSSSRDGGYADAAGRDQESTPSSNHWSQDNGGGNGRRNSGNYQNRRDRGDDRRQDERDRGARGGYRSRNYGGGNNGPQHNGRGGSGGGNSGVYFRNNDPNSSGSSAGGNSGGGNGSYYNQNGGGVYANKEARYDSGGGNGGNYRGPRNNNQRTAAGAGNSGPYVRSLGRNGGGGGASSNNGQSYVNSRQSNRLPISLENKN